MKCLVQREQELNAREKALEQEKILFQDEQAAWTTKMAEQKTKQALIRRGATMMFRTNRLEIQQQREEQEKAMHTLENGLLQTAQQELDFIDQEHAEVIGNLLAATAAQVICTAVSLDAKARANVVSDRLTDALDKVHQERLHIQELTDKMDMKTAELDVLICSAKAERIKVHETLQKSQIQVSRFSLAAEAIGLVQGQIESNAAEDRDRISVTLDKERGYALEEARSETQRRLAALKDARTAFQKLRDTETANLAKGYARVEHSRAIVDMEKELVKKEMVRARLLAIKAEQERAASVDAKKAALEELQAARIMRDESRRALHKLVAIADEMAIPKTSSDQLIKDVTSTVADGEQIVRDKLTEGLKSRFGFHVGDKRAVSHGQLVIGSTRSRLDGMEGGRCLQKRCTSLNIEQDDKSRSSIPSAVLRPRPLTVGSARTEAEDLLELTAATKPSTDVTTPGVQTPSVDVDTETIVPIGIISQVNGKSPDSEKQGISRSLEPSGEKCDKQPGRMKLGSIGNIAH